MTEIEMKDTDDDGTNFYTIGTTGDRDFYQPLSPGDHYEFRARADQPDGTVTDYSDANADAPVPVPILDPNMSLSAPSVSPTGNVNFAYPGTIDEDFAISSVPSSQTYVYVNYTLTSRAGDPFHLDTLSDFVGGDDEDALGVAGDSPIHAMVRATTGATYNIVFAAQGSEDNQYSQPSSPVKVTIPGTLPPALDLKSDKATPGKLTWDVPSGIDRGTVTFYKIGRATRKGVTTNFTFDAVG